MLLHYPWWVGDRITALVCYRDTKSEWNDQTLEWCGCVSSTGRPRLNQARLFNRCLCGPLAPLLLALVLMVISPLCDLLEALDITVFQPRVEYPLRSPNPEPGPIVTKVCTLLALYLPEDVRAGESAPAVIVSEGLPGQGTTLHASSVYSRCVQGPWDSMTPSALSTKMSGSFL